MNANTLDTPNKTIVSEGELFKKYMSNRWNDLHPDIQKRFDKNPLPGKPLYYKGTLDELSCSFWGKLLGYITKPLIQGALIPHSSTEVPVDIKVYSKKASTNIYKERIYRLPNRKPIMFTSHMKEGKNGELLEYVGMGLGMQLVVFEKDSNLHFKSNGYFWDVGIFRIPIPGPLTPGNTYLVHENKGPDCFRILIEITHPYLGKMFTQKGAFHEARESK